MTEKCRSYNENGLHFHTVYSSPSVLHKTPTLWSPNCIAVIGNRILNNIHQVASYDKRFGWCYSHRARVDELTTFYSLRWNHNVLYKQATTNCHTQIPLYLTSLMTSRAPRESSFQKHEAWGCLQVQYVYKHFQLLEKALKVHNTYQIIVHEGTWLTQKDMNSVTVVSC